MKRLLVLLAVWLMLVQTVAAQTVTVDGYGVDENAARRDAARQAVEQVAGTYIASKTLVENYVTQLDEIYAQAQGFVTGMEVMSSGQEGQVWHIRAQVDVDTSADSKLLSRLNTVALLNDPRIHVEILDKELGNGSSHDLLTEQALNEQLLVVGFNHVVSDSRPVDYRVLGTSEVHAYAIKVPDGQGGYNTTPLQSAAAELTVRVVDYATGSIVATFQTTGRGIDNSAALAGNRARKEAAAQAAKELEAKFKKTAMKIHQGITLTVKADSLEKVEELTQKMGNMAGVQKVILRSMDGGTAIIDVESMQKPHVLARMLKELGLNIYISAISNSELKLSLH